MATGTLQGFSVLSALIDQPRSGPWTAELALEGDRVQALGSGQLTLVVGGRRFLGTPHRAPRSFAGRTGVVLVGGKGGLGATLSARFYLGCPASVPLADIVSAAGETLSASSGTAELAAHLSRWSRAKGPAGEALDVLAEHVGATWRVLDDGTVWFGAETWPAADAPAELDVDPAQDVAVFAGDIPSLSPGTTLGGRRIGRVTHQLTESALRATVYFETTSAAWQRGRGGLDATIRRHQAPLRYFGQYAGTVVKLDAAGKLEVKLDTDELPNPTACPIWHGFPGTSVRGAVEGRRVLVGFENGDPEKPYVAGWAEGGTNKLGSLLLVQNAQSMALLPPQWFSAGTAGNTAAAAALAAALAAGNVAYLLPITVPVVEAT